MAATRLFLLPRLIEGRLYIKFSSRLLLNARPTVDMRMIRRVPRHSRRNLDSRPYLLASIQAENANTKPFFCPYSGLDSDVNTR